MRPWLEAAEAAEEDDRLALLCHIAVQITPVPLDEDELNGALRRAALLLATGGDPKRPLELDGRAVAAVAGDLRAPEHDVALARALAELEERVAGLSASAASLLALRQDCELAWRGYAMALLAGYLAD